MDALYLACYEMNAESVREILESGEIKHIERLDAINYVLNRIAASSLFDTKGLLEAMKCVLYLLLKKTNINERNGFNPLHLMISCAKNFNYLEGACIRFLIIVGMRPKSSTVNRKETRMTQYIKKGLENRKIMMEEVNHCNQKENANSSQTNEANDINLHQWLLECLEKENFLSFFLSKGLKGFIEQKEQSSR